MKLFKMGMLVIILSSALQYSDQVFADSYLSSQWQAFKQLPGALQDCLIKKNCTYEQKKLLIAQAARIGVAVGTLAAIATSMYGFLNRDTRVAFNDLNRETQQIPVLDNMVTALNKGNIERLKGYLSKIRFSQSQLNDYLMLAVQSSEPEIVQLFLKNGAFPGAIDGGGNSLLYWAARRTTFSQPGKPDYERARKIIDLLLKYKAPINIAGEDGRTPLTWVSGTSDKELIELFIKNGAEQKSRVSEGRF